MLVSAVLPFFMSAFVTVMSQQPLDDLSEISPYLPSENLEKSLLQQCESFAQMLTEQNERLKNEMKVLQTKVEALEEIAGGEDEEEEEEEDDEKDGSDGFGAGIALSERRPEDESPPLSFSTIRRTEVGGPAVILRESKEPSKSLRSRRAAGCEGGTLAAWACAPQCVFKLKGLCGLSLKSICHC